RKAAQQRALERLARMERGAAGPPSAAPRPRLGRLERPREPERTATAQQVTDEADGVTLTDPQRAMMQRLRVTQSVSAAASALEMSRSNIYASLRRIGRKVGEPDVT